MSWLYGQTWLWYLLAFVVGVAAAWLLLVLPQLRKLRSLQHDRAAGGPTAAEADTVVAAPVTAAPVAAAAGGTRDDTDRRPAVDDAVTEQIPAVDPALSTLDTSHRAADTPAAGLGAAGLAAAATARRTSDEVTREIPRVTGAETTQQIPVTPTPTPTPDDDTAAAAGVGATAAAGTTTGDDAPFGPGSARPAADGSSPDPAFRIKGNVDTMRYHGSRSPYFDRTPAAVWFRTEQDAEAAGFVSWNTRGRGPAIRGLVGGAAAAPPADPAPADPAPADPAPADPAPADPADPAPAEPAPADPAPAGVTAGRFPGSVLPLADGAAPGPQYTIKGNANSMLFHTTDSPYTRIKADVWFVDAADAEAAGFTEWRKRKLG